MMACFHSKERTEADWTHLISSADPRFVLKSVTHAQPGPLAVIEVIWRNSDPVGEEGEANDVNSITGGDAMVNRPFAEVKG